MAKMKAVDEVLKELGVKERSSIDFAMWKPWDDDTAPQGFIGTYKGYKLAEKEQGGDVNQFDILFFDDCTPPAPKGASGFAISSGFMLDNVKYVIPGTKLAVVYEGSEKNVHGGQTRNIIWSFMNPTDKKAAVSQNQLPAMNHDQYRLAANSASV